MNIERSIQATKMCKLRETLLEIERKRINGAKYCTPDELEQELDAIIAAAEESQHAAS